MHTRQQRQQDLRNVSDSRLHVSHGDILKFDYEAALKEDTKTGHAVKIIGNLPFNVATPLLFSFLSMLSYGTGLALPVCAVAPCLCNATRIDIVLSGCAFLRAA